VTASVRLQDCCEIVAGGRQGLTGKDFVNDGFPAFGAGGVNGLLESFEFDRPAVVLSAIGARCGKCFLAEGRWSSLANTQLIFPDPSRVDVRYLWYQLNDERSWHRSGSAQPFIKPSDVKRRTVYLPPIEEQRRIAAVLNEAGELRTKRETSLALINSLNESIFLDMFGSGAYGRESLGDHLAFLTSGSRGWARYYADSGAPFLRIQNVLKDQLDLSDVAWVEPPENAEARRTRVRRGDVLMSITADLGRTCVVPPEVEGAFINQHLCLMRTETLEPRFLSAFLTSGDAVMQIRRKNRAAVKAGLNFDDVRSLQIPIPPLTEQQAFADRAAEVDRQREALEVDLGRWHELFASLQHRAFVGQL